MKHIPLARDRRRGELLRRCGGRAALSFLLSGAQLGGIYAPFALAVVAAAGPRLPGLCTLVGTAAGALLFFDFQTGLRYMAAAILIFAANTAFYDSRLYHRTLFLPAVSAGMLAIVQSVYLVERPPEQWALCAAAAAILAVAVWFLRSDYAESRLARLLLAAALTVGLSRLTIGATFSPGRALGAALILPGAALLSPTRALALGAGIGLAMDLVPTSPVLLFSASYGIGALLVSLLRRQMRPIQALAFCLPCAALPLLLLADSPGALAAEAVLAGIVYLVLPQPLLQRLEKPEADKPAADTAAPFQRSAAAFRDLYDSFFRGTSPAAPENPSVIFDRAAEQVCRSCVLCSRCWQQEYHSTYSAFNDACPALLRRGRALAQDFPVHFSSRCVHFPDFVAAVNAELRPFLLRRQYHQRLLTARQQAQEQYAQLGDLLSSAGGEPAAAAIAQPLGYRIGSALRPKQGEHVCGDQVTVFEVGSTVYLLLSDGMGSGEAAHREAAMTVRLLEQFLKAGIDATPALRTLNSALALRGESGGGFTTIDLLALQRGNGEAALYKYGAAPSYLKKTGSVTRITGQSLPAGLQATAEAPESTHLHLPAGSFLVMVSDGIADETDDEWLQNLLAGWNGRDCHALVSLILSESRSRKGLADDCAVLVLQLPDGDLGKKKV